MAAQDRRERILIVDDEERLWNTLMNYLETEGRIARRRPTPWTHWKSSEADGFPS